MRDLRNGAEAPAALIIAHPGHELLLHHWMERARPTVFVLTDGSGGLEQCRRGHSRRTIEAAGASAGSVFGHAPDRLWYRAILEGDRRMFLEVAQEIADACLGLGVREVVTDAAELFNPMHDLAAALGCGVVARLRERIGADVELFDYAIEREPSGARPAARTLDLDAAAVASKLDAARSCPPLAGEVERWLAGPATQARLAREELRPVDPKAAWPAQPEEEPYYERFGRQRIGEQVYARLITYAEHVRPLALALMTDTAAAEA